METALLILRLVVGGTLAAHGAQKLFGWFGGFGPEGTGGWLESLGFKPGYRYALVNGASEFGGGLLLAFGLLTPLGAAAIIGVMIVAIATVHWDKGFFNTAGGYEFNLLLIATALALAITGPGSISVDNALGIELRGYAWGLTAAFSAAIVAGLVLSIRHRELTDDATVASEDTVIDLRETETTSAGR